MSIFDREKRMLGRIRDKMGQQIGHRPDLYLADFRAINTSTALVLVGYNEHSCGLPTNSQIGDYVVKAFEGKVVPSLATTRLHKEIEAVTVVCELYRATRAYAEHSNMTAIASTLYVDSEMAETWEVRGDGDSRHLARVMKDDISQILQERRSRMQLHSSRNVSLANALSAGILNVDAGALVRFYQDGKILNGEISQVQANGVVVNCEDEGVYTIAREAIVEVLQFSPRTEEELKAKLSTYFAEAYGIEEYGAQMGEQLSGDFR